MVVMLTVTAGGMMYRDVANAMTIAGGLVTRVQVGILGKRLSMAHHGGAADLLVGQMPTHPRVKSQAGHSINVPEKVPHLTRQSWMCPSVLPCLHSKSRNKFMQFLAAQCLASACQDKASVLESFRRLHSCYSKINILLHKWAPEAISPGRHSI